MSMISDILHHVFGVDYDVDGILGKKAQDKGMANLNWQNSIVDLLKVLGLPSDRDYRKQLAQELNYTGDMDDDVELNTWLHDEVMEKIRDHGRF